MKGPPARSWMVASRDGALLGQPGGDGPEHLAVHRHPGDLHPGQHADQGSVDLVVEHGGPRLGQGVGQRPPEPGHHRGQPGAPPAPGRRRDEASFVVEVERPLPLGAGTVVHHHPQVGGGQVTQPVVVDRGVEEVGGHRGVHLQADDVDAQGQQPSHQLLGVVGHPPDAVRAQAAAARAATTSGDARTPASPPVRWRTVGDPPAPSSPAAPSPASTPTGSGARVRDRSSDRPGSPIHAGWRARVPVAPRGHRPHQLGHGGGGRRRSSGWPPAAPPATAARPAAPPAPRRGFPPHRPRARRSRPPAARGAVLHQGLEPGPQGPQLQLGEDPPGRLARPSPPAAGRRRGRRGARPDEGDDPGVAAGPGRRGRPGSRGAWATGRRGGRRGCRGRRTR